MLKDRITAANKIKIEKVTIPELVDNDVPMEIFIKTMDGTAYDKYLSFLAKAQKTGNMAGFRGLLVSLCVCESNGDLVFGSADEVNKLTSNVIESMFEHCANLNKLSKVTEKKDV